MEPITRRVAIHFYTDHLNECVDFYSALLRFQIVKDLELVGGERWAAVAKPDNHGIQLHFHPPRADKDQPPIRLEFSHPDPHALLDDLKAAKVAVTEWSYPWTAGGEYIDPIGNRIALSWWGDEEFDRGNGYTAHAASAPAETPKDVG